MKYLWIFLFLTACNSKQGVPVQISSAIDQFNVEMLFERDGCMVYRFLDGHYHYFVNCEGQTIQTLHEQCGKSTCPRPDEIKTHRKSL